MTVLHIATDVVREAFARRTMLALFIAIGLFLALLTFALNLEVVEGALAAGRLFGQDMNDAIVPVDVALGGLFEIMSSFIFYVGLVFGIVATADIAPKMLAPGRVELLLSLPVRRAELIVGTYLGVVAVALISTAFAIGGTALVLAVKADYVTAAPVWGAAVAVLGFMAIYGVMLAATVFVRSAALSAGCGLGLYIAGLATNNREGFLGWFEEGFVRTLLSILIAPLPRLGELASFGAAGASGKAMEASVVMPVIGGVLIFATGAVVVAIWRVSGKDY
jgi:Cu-processing system permease protein